MATTFPNAIQTFPTMYDVTSADAPLVAQYQDVMQQGDFESARTILQQIPLYEHKIITADLLNTILDTVVAVETYYYSQRANGYEVSASQPSGQVEGDLWFQLTGVVSE